MPVVVVVCFASPLFAAGVGTALASFEESDHVVVHMASVADVGSADVVLVDLIGSEAGMAATLTEAAMPPGRMIVVTAPGVPPNVREILAEGAGGVVPHTCSLEHLRAAVLAVALGNTYIHPSLIEWLVTSLRQEASGISALSPREGEVLAMVAASLTNREVAAQLCISERTVKYHVANILAKLGVRNRRDAVAIFSGVAPIAHASG